MYAEKNQLVALPEFEAMAKNEQLNYELIDGVVLMSPRPSKTHQRISKRLVKLLDDALTTPCEALQEVELILKDTVLIPDLLVTCDNEQEEKNQTTPPLIVMEIISPTSASRDHIIKRRKYEELGIKEYWIISPEEKCVTVFDFTANRHEMYCEGQVSSFVLPAVQIVLEDIFA